MLERPVWSLMKLLNVPGELLEGRQGRKEANGSFSSTAVGSWELVPAAHAAHGSMGRTGALWGASLC